MVRYSSVTEFLCPLENTGQTQNISLQMHLSVELRMHMQRPYNTQ